MIDPNWNEFEKTKSLETTIRSLNGILYGNLVCAGFALV